jgi:PAS domain-containing protein
MVHAARLFSGNSKNSAQHCGIAVGGASLAVLPPDVPAHDGPLEEMQQHPKAPSVSSDAGPRDQDQVLYRVLVDSLTEYAIFAVSPDGLVISWNSGAEKTFGYTQAEIIDRSFDIFFTN